MIIVLLIFICPGQRERSPDYQKLYARDTHIRGIRKGQPNRSAMEKPRPGGTAFLITVTSAPGKYALLPFESQLILSIDRYYQRETRTSRRHLADNRELHHLSKRRFPTCSRIFDSGSQSTFHLHNQKSISRTNRGKFEKCNRNDRWLKNICNFISIVFFA